VVGRTPVRCEVVCDLRPAVPVRVCRRRRVRRDRGLAGWKCSPLLACFRASVGQLNDERLPTQRRQKARHQCRRGSAGKPRRASRPEPTLEERHLPSIRNARAPGGGSHVASGCISATFSSATRCSRPMAASWISAPACRLRVPGRVPHARSADLGRRRRHALVPANDLWVWNRRDPTPIHATILRRLKDADAELVHDFPELYVVQLGRPEDHYEGPSEYSVSRCAAADLAWQKDRTEFRRLKVKVSETRAQAREDAMRSFATCDHPGVPPRVRAATTVWPPA
jgi:hypothetical protein